MRKRIFAALIALVAIATVATPVAAETARCVSNEAGLALQVNLDTAALHMCRDGIIEARYPIVIPMRSKSLIERQRLRTNPIRGRVRAVWRDPVWQPTQNIRAAYAQRDIFFPDVVAPYSRNKGNPLGVGFIVLEFPDRRLSNDVGIHGTNKPQLVIEGRKDSFDCIRACNLHWLQDIGPSVERELQAGREVQVFFIAVRDPLDEAVRQTTMPGCHEVSLPPVARRSKR